MSYLGVAYQNLWGFSYTIIAGHDLRRPYLVLCGHGSIESDAVAAQPVIYLI